MLVKFDRYGGFHGPAMQYGCEVDTDELPAADAEQLEHLVADARRSNYRTGPAPANVPDQFAYELEIESEDGVEQFELVDMNVTKESMQLIQWLLQRSQARPAKGDPP